MVDHPDVVSAAPITSETKVRPELDFWQYLKTSYSGVYLFPVL